MKQEPIESSPETTEIYEGLDWRQKGTTSLARSDTTGSTYLVEKGAGDLWCVRNGFPDRPGRPNILIGQYADFDIALVSAERHDYRFWKSSADRAGLRTIFLGSKGKVADFVSSIPEHERDEMTDMLISEPTLEDGRPFSSAASFFEAVKGGLKQEKNGKFTLTLTIDAETTPMWLLQTAMGSSLTLGAVETGKKEDQEWIERGKQAIRRAAVLPADNSFQSWILHRYDRWALVRTAMAKSSDDVEMAVAETLRRIIGCPSRRELAGNRDAIMKIERLDREFYLDLSRGAGPE